jgi:hypothetical protein
LRARRRLSALELTVEGVAVRNFPGRTRRIPLAAIDRFDEAFLLLTDGSRLKVGRLGEAELGTGVTGLDNRLEHMRRAAVGE